MRPVAHALETTTPVAVPATLQFSRVLLRNGRSRSPIPSPESQGGLILRTTRHCCILPGKPTEWVHILGPGGPKFTVRQLLPYARATIVFCITSYSYVFLKTTVYTKNNKEQRFCLNEHVKWMTLYLSLELRVEVTAAQNNTEQSE